MATKDTFEEMRIVSLLATNPMSADHFGQAAGSTQNIQQVPAKEMRVTVQHIKPVTSST